MDVHELTDIIHVIKMPLFQIVCLSCVEHPQVCSINSEICGSALSEVKHTSSQMCLLLFLIQTADQQHSEKQKQGTSDNRHWQMKMSVAVKMYGELDVVLNLLLATKLTLQITLKVCFSSPYVIMNVLEKQGTAEAADHKPHTPNKSESIIFWKHIFPEIITEAANLLLISDESDSLTSVCLSNCRQM